MVVGTVNAKLEPMIQLSVLDADGKSFSIPAVVDCGFNGDLTLPKSVIEHLRLNWRRRETMTLADGTQTLVDTYAALVVWHEKPRIIAIEASVGLPLVGTGLLAACDLHIRFVNGGPVTIEQVP